MGSFVVDLSPQEQPKGFSKVTLQQLLDCDRQLFTLASHQTMGRLTAPVGEPKSLDSAIGVQLARLSGDGDRDGKRSGKTKSGSISIPDGCVTHDDNNKPLCFKFQQGKCSFKGQEGSDVQKVITSATGLVVFATNHTIGAPILTDS